MPYIDFAWYDSHFPKLSESEFTAKLPAAEMTVDIKTNYRSRQAQGYKLEAVQACVANVINTLAAQEETQGNLKSVSNDGYSETYETVTKAQAEKEIHSVCRKWLSGTGLMRAL